MNIKVLIFHHFNLQGPIYMTRNDFLNDLLPAEVNVVGPYIELADDVLLHEFDETNKVVSMMTMIITRAC